MNTRLNKAFGKVLKETRDKTGLSQEALAEASGYHSTYISQLERGLKNPTLEAIFRLSTALGRTAHSLVRVVEGRLS